MSARYTVSQVPERCPPRCDQKKPASEFPQGNPLAGLLVAGPPDQDRAARRL